MIVLDSNAVIHYIQLGKPMPVGILLVPDDLQDEYEVMALRHGGHRLPTVTPASSHPSYSEAYYYQRYVHYINAYSQVYLARMSGLADVSILTLVDCLITNFGNGGQQLSLDLGINTDKVIVISDDGKLKKMLEAEFGEDVDVVSSADI